MNELDSDLRPVSWTAGATAWFGAMPAAELYAAMGILPAVIYAAAAIARTRPHDAARSVAQTVSGEWMSLDVAVLEGRGDDGLAVTVRAATSGETFSILCRAYGLTTRERQLAELVVDGHDTREVSLLMGISRHTVQDHLKSMFDKVGVHSRRQLLSLLARPMDDAGGRYAD